MKKFLLFHVFFIFCFFSEPAFANNIILKHDIIKALLHKIPKQTYGKNRGFGRLDSVEQPSVALIINFKKDSAELNYDDISQLVELGKALKDEKLQGWVYKIEGHTCDLGTDEHNMILSKNRALAVLNYLTSNFNFSPKQFQTQGFGERFPQVKNTDENARKQNRRVVIKKTMISFTPKNAKLNKINIQIKTLGNNYEKIIKEGQDLISSEHYVVEFFSSEYSYIYIYQFDSLGKTNCLFPNLKFSLYKNPIKTGFLYRIPEYQQSFILDHNTGKETFIIFAHNTPLTESECMNIIEQNRGMGDIVNDRPHVSDKKNIFVKSISFVHK